MLVPSKNWLFETKRRIQGAVTVIGNTERKKIQSIRVANFLVKEIDEKIFLLCEIKANFSKSDQNLLSKEKKNQNKNLFLTHE